MDDRVYETKWQNTAEPDSLVWFVREMASQRKLRLLCCAFCRHLWRVIGDYATRASILIGERYADRSASLEDLRVAHEAILRIGNEAFGEAWGGLDRGAKVYRTIEIPLTASQEPIEPRDVWRMMPSLWDAGETNHERTVMCQIIRDIFGNPFRPPPPRPEAIAPLGERIYAGEWELMPLLGEWLQEHGYWSEGEHCLEPNIHHVKGCWVVDWVTGRE
jgi:hypothetical protein